MPTNDLSEKLKRLMGALPAGVVTGSQLLEQRSEEKDLPDMSRFIPGEIRSRPEGTCFVTDEFFPFDGFFGSYPLERLARLNAREVAQTFGLEEPEGDRILFIDTETTGISGGTGTYAFQVGVGWIEDEGFRVLQYFMRDYDEEPAQMAAVGEEIANCGLLVTYNGAAFDLPLLRTRFLFNRVRIPLEEIPHLDMLPVARRLWKPEFGGAKLSFLEEKVLGNVREGDVPGALIPTLYFHFLRGASPRTLAPVFYHNRMDIVALAALTERAFSCHADPFSIESPWERFGVARFCEARGRETESLRLLETLMELEEKHPSWAPSVKMLGFLLKRAARFEEAAEAMWKVHRAGIFDPVVHIELAKHLEHREKNYGEAHRLVIEVFEKYEIEPKDTVGGESDEEGPEENLRYDFSEGVRGWRDELPSLYRDNDDEEFTQPPGGRPIPKMTERFEADLNRRLARLRRKLGKSTQ